jgi:RNA polymerase sigma-70 factor, ECF subfamily
MKNEGESFAALFREHFAWVLSAVRWFGVHPRNAEDVAQDVFLKVFEALDRCDRSRPIKPWLKTVTYRTARDHLKLSRTRERLTETGQVDRMEPTANPEQRLLVKQAQETLWEVLQSLHADDRTVFFMAEFDQRTKPEIAQALGIRKPTVQSRLRRAREDFDKAVYRKHMLEEHRFSCARVQSAHRSPCSAGLTSSRRAL